MKTKIILCFAVVLSAYFSASAYQYAAPEKTNDGWEIASLDDEKLDAGLFKEIFERIGDKSYKNVHSVLLVKNGKLVVEEYFSGQTSAGQFQMFTRDTLNEMKSATKSVNSILVGISIDRHLIHSVDGKVSSFFPNIPTSSRTRKKTRFA